MGYHLHHQGEDLGVFPLEELRRRRMAGELTGMEYVWGEGMAEWQTLDAMLQTNGPPGLAVTPPPLPAPPPKRQRTGLIAAVAVGGVVLIAAIAAVGYRGAQVWKRMTGIYRVEQRNQRAGGNSDAAGGPIAWNPNSATERDVQKRAREFRVRQWVEGYQARGRHDSSCDALSLEMLQAWVARHYGGSTNTEAVSVTELADRLAANGECKDPLALTVAGVESIEMFEKIKRLERALNAFPQSQHRGYPRLYAAASLAETEEYGSEKMRSLDGSALRFLRDSFSDGSFTPEDQRELADIFITGWGYNFFYRRAPAVTGLVQSAGKPYQWLGQLLDGEQHVMLAWRARGGGYADSVTPQGWEGFRTNLIVARQSFSNAWHARPDWPLAAARMVYVAMSDSDSAEMRLWFNRAVAAQLDQPQAWNNLRWGLRPRWHGSLEAMLALGKAAVDTGRFDTDVPRKFFDVVTDLEAELQLGRGQHLYGRSDIWPYLQRMYEGYVAEPSEPARAGGWRTTFAVVACLAGQYDVAREQLEALQWQPWSGNFHGWGRDVSLMTLEVAGRTGPVGPQITAAESSRLRGDLPEAMRILKELTDSTNADERTRSFVRYRLAALETEMRLHGNGWIDFLPAAQDDPAWRVSAGKVQRLPDGTLEVEASQHGHLLFSRARVGPDFEVKGEFDVALSSTKDFQAGLVMGLPEVENSDWLAFRMKRNRVEGDIVSFSRGWTRQQTTKRVALKDGLNSFRFRLEAGKATASLNDTEVLRGATPGKTGWPVGGEVYVGLGAFNDMNETVIRYHNVQVRRLAGTPASVQSP